jgi:hypothetical protein
MLAVPLFLTTTGGVSKPLSGVKVSLFGVYDIHTLARCWNMLCVLVSHGCDLDHNFRHNYQDHIGNKWNVAKLGACL